MHCYLTQVRWKIKSFSKKVSTILQSARWSVLEGSKEWCLKKK